MTVIPWDNDQLDYHTEDDDITPDTYADCHQWLNEGGCDVCAAWWDTQTPEQLHSHAMTLAAEAVRSCKNTSIEYAETDSHVSWTLFAKAGTFNRGQDDAHRIAECFEHFGICHTRIDVGQPLTGVWTVIVEKP